MKTQHCFCLDNGYGALDVHDLMKMFRCGFKSLGGIDVEKVLVHRQGPERAPDTDIVEYHLADGSSVLIEPSGTEPELTISIRLSDSSTENAADLEKSICEDIENIIYLDQRACYCCE